MPDALIAATLFAFLCAAAYSDVKAFRIPNILTLSGVLAGILMNALLPSGIGFLPALYGFAVGLFGLLPLYLLRIWGAGDVKLMAVVGAFLGTAGLFGSLLASLVAGGVAALVVAWHRREGRVLFDNLRCMLYQMASDVQLRHVKAVDAPAQSAGKLAYAIPILLGTLGYLIYQACV